MLIKKSIIESYCTPISVKINGSEQILYHYSFIHRWIPSKRGLLSCFWGCRWYLNQPIKVFSTHESWPTYLLFMLKATKLKLLDHSFALFSHAPPSFLVCFALIIIHQTPTLKWHLRLPLLKIFSTKKKGTLYWQDLPDTPLFSFGWGIMTPHLTEPRLMVKFQPNHKNFYIITMTWGLLLMLT